MSVFAKNQRACLEHLLELKAPSRLGARDAILFNVCPDGMQRASRLLGWTTLCSNPPLPIAKIQEYAAAVRAEGLEAVVLMGQGGSSQAAMTITKLHELSSGSEVAFRTMDSLSPVFVNHILGSSDPARTLYIVASKSGSTIEPLMLERVAWRYVAASLGAEKAARRFVAITDPGSNSHGDPGSDLEQLARAKGYRLVLPTPADVGGRFSALTAFALFPAALVGIDIADVIAAARATEQTCTADDPQNPALELASFLYASYLEGRDKISLILPSTGQVFGLWVEQLVAESLGKDGKGIVPNVEVDASILHTPRSDRSAITCAVGSCEGFHESLTHIDASIPLLRYTVDTPQQAFSRFVIWEYAIAFLSLLLEVFPFDQPDVEITKVLAKQLLAKQSSAEGERGKEGTVSIGTAPSDAIPNGLTPTGGTPTDATPVYHELGFDTGIVQTLRASTAVLDEARATPASLDEALRALLGSLRPGDYFSLNAFLPFRGYGRREALERMRNRVASRLGIVSCLEIGPRYLHSTGQLHKGGPNNGVFLLISAEEDNDIAIPGEDFTLGALAATQAQADFAALASRGRRVLYLHLTGNDSETLSHLADRTCSAISAIKVR